MTSQIDAADRGPLTSRPRAVQWLVLVAASAALASLLELGGFPAALLLGPMLAGIVMGVLGATVRTPPRAVLGAQALIGCLVAASFSPDSMPAFLRDWPILVAAVFATLVGSSFLGWLISRYQVLPGTVGVWGSAPGAATAMVLMAGAFGADQRLVAFMQYYRVILVTAIATGVARLWASGSAVPDIDWFPTLHALPLASTLAVAVAGSLFGNILRLPTPFLVGPMALGLALQLSGIAQFQLPPWLLAICFACVGWTIGLRFTRQTLLQMRKALPHVTLAILALLLFCGTIGFLLAEFAGVDPLTAYLATSPGAMEAVAIIAAGSANVDMSFIMALQMLRFLVILLAGPYLARSVARLVRTKD